MNNKKFTVAILGVGARGGNIYGNIISSQDERFKINAICDIRQDRLDLYGDAFGVPKESRFLSEDAFFEARRADALIIATYDRYHARQAERALRLGYTVLLEKPIATSIDELSSLEKAQKETGGRLIICHVLRYAPVFIKMLDLVRSGEIGRLVTISAEEPVSYWHQAHSFVRGNARGGEISASMLLAKCCHDLDLICAFAAKRPTRVSSFGSLTYFKPENAPGGAASRCTDCRYIESCPYSAKKIYIDGWHKAGYPENTWPTNALADRPITEEKLYMAIREGNFGRCVFASDNDAVDNQFVIAEFEGGIRASLSMTAFNPKGGRRYLLGGTHGQIELSGDTLTVTKFGEMPITYTAEELKKALCGGTDEAAECISIKPAKPKPRDDHGGGDAGLISSLYATLSGSTCEPTLLEYSLDGYKLALAAEKSRASGGALVNLEEL